MTAAEFQHRLRTIHAERSDVRKCLCKSDRHIGRSTAEVDHTAAGELWKSFTKISGNLPVRFAPIGCGIRRGLLVLIHQLRFSGSFHAVSRGYELPLVPHQPRYLQALISK